MRRIVMMVTLVMVGELVFAVPITGRILDANPGLVGFQHYFMFLTTIALVGAFTAAWLVWLQKSRKSHWQDVAVRVK
jgi:uncharacterized membrane protein